MNCVRHAEQAWDPWRPGVRTRMWSGDVSGAHALHMFEQVCDPGLGAPTHRHAAEEHLTFLAGRAEVWLAGERRAVDSPATVVVPPRTPHGFRNLGPDPLHVLCAMAGASFAAAYDGDPAGVEWRAFESVAAGRRQRVDLGTGHPPAAG